MHKQLWVKHLPVSPIINLTNCNASGDDRLAGVAVVGLTQVSKRTGMQIEPIKMAHF